MYVGFDYLLENFHAIDNAINEIKKTGLMNNSVPNVPFIDSAIYVVSITSFKVSIMSVIA